VTDFSIGLTFPDELEDFGRKPIRFHALACPAHEYDAAFLCSGDSGAHAFTQQIPLELRERRHQRCDEFPLRATQVKLQPGLGYERDVP